MDLECSRRKYVANIEHWLMLRRSFLQSIDTSLFFQAIRAVFEDKSVLYRIYFYMLNGIFDPCNAVELPLFGRR